jgi:hypothetical protein
MPRKRRPIRNETPLSKLLSEVMQRESLTIRDAAKVAGCAPSVLGAWLKGSFPGAETMPALKRFCTRYGVSLSVALTGEREQFSAQLSVDQMFGSADIFDGYLQVTIKRLIPRNHERDK